MGEFTQEVSDFEYMALSAEGIYKAGYNSEGYNKKLNVFTNNFLGYYAVKEEYQDIYMFDVNDFNNCKYSLSTSVTLLSESCIEMFSYFILSSFSRFCFTSSIVALY